MAHTGDVEHGAEHAFPDLVLFVAVFCDGAGGIPVAVILVHLTDLLLESHEMEDGIDLLRNGLPLRQDRAPGQQEQHGHEVGLHTSYYYFVQLTFAERTSRELP